MIERVQAVLDEEADKRRAFREWLRDDVKAGFINGETICTRPLSVGIWFLKPVAVLYGTDTRSSLTGPGFQIPVRAIFGQENNLSTL